MSKSAVQFATDRRIHVSLAVSDVERSRRFYHELFGTPPTKTRSGYVRFEVEEPPLNLSIIESDEPTGHSNNTSHFGIQVKSTADVGDSRQRLESAGLTTLVEDSVNCCHAVQDKIWIRDPDGHRWEVFVVLDDTPENAFDHDQTCCPTATSDVGSTSCC